MKRVRPPKQTNPKEQLIIEGITLEEWFEKLALNVLPYELYESHSREECAFLVFQRYLTSPERSWGWSWGGWLTVIFDGDEHYMRAEQEVVDRELLDYVVKLALKVPKEKQEELKKLLTKEV